MAHPLQLLLLLSFVVLAAKLAGALATYVMAGLAFAVLYGVIATYRPEAFQTATAAPVTFPDLVYFSFVSLMTIGYGDVTAAGPFARAFVISEGLFGVMFTTIVMASLVAAYLQQRQRDNGYICPRRSEKEAFAIFQS